MSKVEASVLQDTESRHLVMTIHLSSGKDCLLTWLGGLPMTMTNDSLSALTHNSGILMVNTLHHHPVVDHITVKVRQPLLVPSNTRSAMDVQIHLRTLHPFCHHGQNTQPINFQHPTQCISHNQETLLISTNRVSIPLPNQDQTHSSHNL